MAAGFELSGQSAVNKAIRRYASHSMRRLTKVAARPTSWRLARRDKELIFLAAAREEISQTEFVRLAIRDRAQRVLADSSSIPVER